MFESLSQKLKALKWLMAMIIVILLAKNFRRLKRFVDDFLSDNVEYKFSTVVVFRLLSVAIAVIWINMAILFLITMKKNRESTAIALTIVQFMVIVTKIVYLMITFADKTSRYSVVRWTIHIFFYVLDLTLPILLYMYLKIVRQMRCEDVISCP
ncbi:hypothetical protein HDE_04876 [Halotydeus destructor]|nr:hypothetical protein HDE_04876 [Halotydeus destructor]